MNTEFGVRNSRRQTKTVYTLAYMLGEGGMEVRARSVFLGGDGVVCILGYKRKKPGIISMN